MLSSGISFLQGYLEANKTLVKTLVIKSEVSALRINKYLVLKHGAQAVIESQPETWKYYLNITGQYHGTDTPMRVTSLDTLEEILFSRDSLNRHTRTAEAYQYGSRYYYSLLAQYPDQEQLILGILYPTTLDRAIDAQDGEILAYPEYLVEEQEQTLIHELQAYVLRYLKRWNVRAFGVTETLYAASYHALLYLSLLPKLLNLRNKRTKTSEAHSFHVREHLSSKGKLDPYLPYMTKKQALWFYRNLQYLENHAGSTQTFNYLVQHVLTERQIPLADYTIRQLSGIDDNYRPEIRARRRPLNTEVNTSEVDYVGIDTLFTKENRLASGTTYFYENHSKSTILAFQNADSSVIQSKNIESNMVDYSDAVLDPLINVLMRTWVQLTQANLYEVVVLFKDPLTGEARSLYAKDALIYYLYVFYSSIGYPPQHIPDCLVTKGKRRKKPTVAQLLAVVDANLKLDAVAEDLYERHWDLERCTSSVMFHDQALALYNVSRYEWFLLCNTFDLERRGYIENMINQFYVVEQVSLTDGLIVDYKAWLAAHSLPEYRYTHQQSQELLKELLESATGMITDDTRVLKNIQKAMMGLFTEMCSYTIQAIVEINDSQILPMAGPGLRLGNIRQSSQQDELIDADVEILTVSAKAQANVELGDAIATLSSTSDYQIQQDVYVKTTVLALKESGQIEHHSLDMGISQLSVSYSGYDPVLYSRHGYYGVEAVLSMSADQRNQLVSIYQ